MLVQLPVTHKMRSVCDLGVQFHSVYDIFSPPNTCTMHHDKLFGPYSTAKVQWPVRFACWHGFLPWEISKNRTYNKPCTRWWSQICFFHPYLGKWSNLTSIFLLQLGGLISPSSCSNVRVGAFNLAFFRQIRRTSRHWCWTFSAPRLLSGWTCNLGLQMLALRPTKKNGRRKSRLSGSRWISLEIRFLCWHF